MKRKIKSPRQTNPHKAHHKLFLVGLMIILINLCLISLPLISAADFDNVKSFDEKVGNYGKVTIKNLFGLQTLAELELKINTDTCFEDCSAETEIIMHQEGVLIDEIRFMTLQKDDSWKEEEITSYEFYIKEGGLWKKYTLGDEVLEGTYYVKLEGKKDKTKTIDWQITSWGKIIDDWALWEAEYRFEYYNTGDNGASNVIDVEAHAQTFTVGNVGSNANFILTNISLYVSKSGTGAEFEVLLWRVNSTGAPDKIGGNLSQGVYDGTGIGAGNEWINVSMSAYTLEADTTYAFVVVTFSAAPNYILLREDDSSPTYTGGQEYVSTDVGDSFNPLTRDLMFEIHGLLGITLNYPAEEYLSPTNLLKFNCTATAGGGSTLVNMSLWTNETGNWEINQTDTTMTGVTDNAVFTTSIFEPTLWSCQACDSDGDCGMADENRTVDVDITSLLEISQTYNNETTEGNIETFNITIRYNSIEYPNIQGNLVYNGTSYVGTKTDVGENTIFSRTIKIPLVTADQNRTFYWDIILINNTNNHFNSTFNNQTVRNIAIDDCSVHTTLILNATLYDEKTQEYLDVGKYNTSISIDVDIFSEGETTPIIEYSQNYSEINSGTVCLNDDLSNSTYQMDVQILYEGDGYASEFYHIQNYTLTNETTTTFPLNISLFDLLDADVQKFKLIVRDTSYLPISGALIQIERKYIEEGTFHIVEIPKTDEKGITSSSLQLNDIIYNFHIYKTGVLIYSFTNMLAICQTPLVTECTIDFNAFQTEIGIPDYEEGDDFLFTLEYNDTSKVIKSEFIIPSGTVATGELEVIKEDALGTTVCSDTLTSVSGTLSCTVPSSFGNSTVLAKIYKDGIEQGRGSIKLDQQPSDIFGVVLIMMSVLVMMTLIGIGISDSPVITGVFIVVGLILLFSMNLVKNTGFIGATATILFFIIAMIIVIIKAAKRS